MKIHQLVVIPFPNEEEHPPGKAFGSVHHSSGPVAVIALDYYYELSKARKVLAQIQSLDHHKEVQDCEKHIDKLILDHEQERCGLIVSNNLLKSQVEKTISTVMSSKLEAVEEQMKEQKRSLGEQLAEQKRSLREQLEEQKRSVDSVLEESRLLRERDRLRELTYASAEVIFELQRLIVVQLKLTNSYDDANRFTSELFTAVRSGEPTEKQKQLVADFGKMLTEHGLMCNPQQFCEALNSFKRVRLQITHPQECDTDKSLEDYEADLFEYCELQAQESSRSQKAEKHPDVKSIQDDKLGLVSQAHMIVRLVKALLPPNRHNRLFGY